MSASRFGDAIQAGRYDEARETFKRIWPVLDFLCAKGGYAVSTKAAAAAAGIDAGHARAPYGALRDDLNAELTQLVRAADISYA